MFILATEQFKIIFFSNAEALRRLHSPKFSVSQTELGICVVCLGDLAGFVCGHRTVRAVQRKSLPHVSCKLLDLN